MQINRNEFLQFIVKEYGQDVASEWERKVNKNGKQANFLEALDAVLAANEAEKRYEKRPFVHFNFVKEKATLKETFHARSSRKPRR